MLGDVGSRARIDRLVLVDAWALFDDEKIRDIVKRSTAVMGELTAGPTREDAANRLFAELDPGHFPMLTMPEALTNMLVAGQADFSRSAHAASLGRGSSLTIGTIFSWVECWAYAA